MSDINRQGFVKAWLIVASLIAAHIPTWGPTAAMCVIAAIYCIPVREPLDHLWRKK